MTARPIGITILVLGMLVGCTANIPSGSQPASVPAEATDDVRTPPPVLSPTPTPATSQTPSASPRPESSAPTATASTAPPALAIGGFVKASVEGLRARARPGTSAIVIDTLPRDTFGRVELGPLPADGYDWYKVGFSYPDGAGRGWIASGTREAPWLAPTEPRGGGYGPIVGYAGSGSTLIDAVPMDDPWQEIRWAASGSSCSFELTFESESQRAVGVDVVVDGYADGVVEDLFPETPHVVGSVAVRITTECHWTYAIVTYIG